MREEQLFHQALEQSPDRRAAFLDAACSSDVALRERLEALLRACDNPGSFLQLPAAAVYSPTLVERPATEAPGMVIGPYKLLEQIGEGGFGNVFMAEQTAPVRRMVALKVIKPGMDTRQVIARFEVERQALALMDHPNIAKVLDAGTTQTGRPYFVMELVRGVPITTYCDQRQLSPRERLDLFITVCQAVQHAHQKGIIHRDIKPTNVLVTQHDDRPVVKVIDFGVAKAMSGQLTDKTLFTGFSQMIGTPLYMSPEQTEMSGLGVDTRSDIYSLGVLLYELLTGTTPLSHKRIEDAGFDEILRMIREEEPPKPSTRLAQSSETLPAISARRHMEPAKLTKLMRGELDWIVMKTLEKDRSRRYETASAFAADVQRYLRDETVEACPPSPWYRFRKFARRNKRGLLSASAVVLATLLTATVSGVLIWQSIDRERSGAYYERIALAEREWGANNLSRMQQLLEQCPEDLRGWEWHYLQRLPYGVLPPLRHESPVYRAAFSTDNRYLATATKDGVITLWRAATGVEVRRWRAHEANATCLDFSPDGRFLASGGWDSQIKIWDVERVLQSEPTAPAMQLEHPGQIRVWSVAFSPDGQVL
jgi:serine/threonine protein kinase